MEIYYGQVYVPSLIDRLLNEGVRLIALSKGFKYYTYDENSGSRVYASDGSGFICLFRDLKYKS